MSEQIKPGKRKVIIPLANIPEGDVHETREAVGDLPGNPVFSHYTARTKGNKTKHF